MPRLQFTSDFDPSFLRALSSITAAVCLGASLVATAETWTAITPPTDAFICVATSADGSRVFAVTEAGRLYTSTNSGANWSLNSATNHTWYNLACSADGTHLVAVSVNESLIYLS